MFPRNRKRFQINTPSQKMQKNVVIYKNHLGFWRLLAVWITTVCFLTPFQLLLSTHKNPHDNNPTFIFSIISYIRLK